MSLAVRSTQPSTTTKAPASNDQIVEKELRDAVSHYNSEDDVASNAKEITFAALPASLRSKFQKAASKAEKDLGGESSDSYLYEVKDKSQDVVGYVIHAIASGEPDWQGSQLVGFNAAGKELFNESEDIS